MTNDIQRFSTTEDHDSDIADTMHPTITEEAQDLMMSSDGDIPGAYNPPPHVAARIYRNTAARRKSSAASSRRNSMSSHHSNRSARSCHGGPQSTHIAQHLRRASIIESRKAKIADRNAHAEKVRLRAALNKAAPRVATNSEERAVAAQQARERYLAQVKASCAEEVKRSKRVAEDQREKRAAEHLKLIEDMEERHADVEKRKALLQQSQRRKTVSLATVEETKDAAYVWKPRNQREAATIIQRAWKKRQTKLVIQEFLQLGLTVEAVQKTSFEEVGVLLNKDKVLSCTAKVLRLCGLKDEEDDSTGEKTAVRTFLSTFLILGHPAHVLSNDGEQEQDLINQTRHLLLCFNLIVDSSSDSNNTLLLTRLSDLSGAYTSFRSALAAWKAHDSSYLISGMLAQFVELDAIWQTVKHEPNGEVAADYKAGIEYNKALVYTKLKRLAGPETARNMVRDAIKTNRKAKSKKKPAQYSKPRLAPEMLNTANESILTSVIPNPAAGSRSPSNNRSDPVMVLGGQTLLPDNRSITHEVAINKEFRIDAEPKAEIREEFINEFTKNLQIQLVFPGGSDIWIPAFVALVKNKLLSFIPSGNSFHGLVSEALDREMVTSQVRNQIFSYQTLFSFMNSILPKLCAPARDAEVKDLATDPSQDPVRQLARLYFIVDLIQLDMLNFRIAQSASMLLKESIGYERRAFARYLDGRFPVRTLQWWKTAKAKAEEDASRRPSELLPTPANRVTPTKIYMQGLTDLAIATNSVYDGELPETFELDRARIHGIRSDSIRIITISSVLLTAKNLLRRDVRSLWKVEAQRMWDLPPNSVPATFVSIVESRYALPPNTKQQLTGTITRLLSDSQNWPVTHPVMKVLLKKLNTHVLTRLSASSVEERLRTSTTATEVLGSGGMPEFVGRIGEIVQELGRVADVDREAHSEWYDHVAKRASAESEETS